MSNPFFSVIMPTHNGARYIGKMLDSILTQSFTNYELIVVCDSCTDNTIDYVKSIDDDKIRIIEVDYHRDGLSRNAGLDEARGEWILFADDDDWYLHEYCFEILAKKIKDIESEKYDTVDFAFIWKEREYMMPTKARCRSMAWCRAWRRSFIGNNRYCDLKYGSDSEFFDRIIKDNSTVKIYFWNMPLYYYNYNREGSLSWMLHNGMIENKTTDKQNNCAYLDIIITHHDEPWEVGKKLFDSIRLQECVRYEHFNVTIVQDGTEGALEWDDLLKDYPFHVNVVTLKKHGGVSAARNAGIEYTSADWILFMDFDDMFADVASLCMITRLFPVSDEVDIIHSKYIREVYDYGRFKDTTFNCEDDTDYRMIGKIYRRSFLNGHRIRFRNECQEYNELIFNVLAFAETFPHRIAAFDAPFYPYYKKLRLDGAFSTIDTLDKKIEDQFERNVILADELKRRDKKSKYHMWMIRVLADCYYSIRSADLEPDVNKGITNDLIMFWKENRSIYDEISKNDIEVALDEAMTEAMTYVQEYYNYFGKEFYLQNDMITFADFLHELDKKAGFESDDTVQEEKKTEVDNITPIRQKTEHREPHHDDRVVVYCGTKETYVNMIASVKSLLATTPVDKVFFLIEDDEFPYEIPDIIETRNVKDIDLFDHSGPNYANAWTYMCLMRTAYPDMFKEYSKVLSLDIDVVITEDISNLWDIDLTDYYFAGVPEEGRVKRDSKDMYANFGVIMMNLDKLRHDNLGQKLIQAVNTEHFGCPEQDAFNKYCKGHIFRLPNDYNVTVYSHITGEPLQERILHYAGLKYWKHFGPVQKFFKLEWSEIMSMQEALHE